MEKDYGPPSDTMKNITSVLVEAWATNNVFGDGCLN